MAFRRGLSSLWLAGCIALAMPALADETRTYQVVGEDVFRIANRNLSSEISYAGNQRLVVKHPSSGATTFAASATYNRLEGGISSRQSADFAATMLADGDLRQVIDHDPDYLTILNQPFSVELDAPTMRDLRHLEGAVPFDFPSPMTGGAVLHGTLRRLADGSLAGSRVLGIAFSANGPLNGALPDRPAMTLNGTITMNGTAYYAYADALLLALDATLEITGTVTGSHDPVTIVYRRTIRPPTR